MRIVVTIANADPPQGRITSSGHEEPTEFVGWLGLIRVLADAVAAADSGEESPSWSGQTALD